MAASPDFKVYHRNEYRAACKYVEDAAALVAVLGDGAQIRYGHRSPNALKTACDACAGVGPGGS